MQNILFHNHICCFPVVFTLYYPKYELKIPVVFTLFYPKYELKFNVLVLWIMAPPQKLVLAPGATLRYNTVHNLTNELTVTASTVTSRMPL